tara:strand:+ start:2167 stop:2922 length:756 start_codon:yes stop_codon:yes gene_type:complete
MAKRNKRKYHELNETTEERQLYLVKDKHDNIGKQAGLKLNEIHPKTKAQSDTFDSYNENYNLMLHGCAGTGKTFISMYLALSEVFKKSPYKSVTVVRSAVPTREIGFLPGGLHQKLEVYEMPYRSIITELYGRGDAFDVLKHKDVLNFISTSYIRGLTLKRTIVIVDECENLNFHELDSIITRIGSDCKILFCGDFKQSDFRNVNEKQGMHNFMEILSGMRSFNTVKFTQNDIVRSNMVREYIIQKDNLNY